MSHSQNLPFQSGYNEVEEEYQAHRWTTGSNDEGARDVFTRYASGTNQISRNQGESIRAGGESHRRYVTEVSQISNIGDGFKKTKYNQLETLKELRQEYEILRNLPLQEEFLDASRTKKHVSSSSYDSQNQEDSVSSSSKATNKKKRRIENEDVRSTQILTLEKRQLELVIGNSMRKIEELLNNEIEYKRTIHELQIQLDSRTSDEKIESLTKAIKRTESEFTDKIENLKREIERLQQTIKQLEKKNSNLEADHGARGDELNRYLQEKRTLEDQLRIERDRYANLEIEIRRVTMESSIVEKDKNSEISRLNSLILARDPTSGEYKKLEEELRISKHKYETLFDEFERFKIEVNARPKENIRDNKQSEEQIRLFEALINHMREDSANQNRASIDLINSMVSRLEDRGESKKGNQDGRFLEELFNLRNEVSTLKREKEDRSINGLAESVAKYQYKIQNLEQEIANGTISKENLLKEYENIKSSYNYAKEEYSNLNDEYQKLKRQVQEGSFGGHGSSDETIRQLKRQLDEAMFMVEKSKKEIDFNVNLVRSENESAMRLLQEQISRIEGEKELLKGELNKMRAFYESKIQEKNLLIERTTKEFSTLSETKERTLFAYKNNTEKEMNELIRKIEGMAELNQRYLSQSTYLSNIERELHELRYSTKRMKNINDGVDHLWSVKETEYHNVNEILQHLKSQ